MPDATKTEQAPNAKPARDLPEVRVAPQLPTPTEYDTLDAVRASVLAHVGGSFYEGALLAERMMWNARVWSVVQTRTNGLIATEQRWKEGRKNRDGRRALEAWRQDYPRMLPTAVRKLRAVEGLLTGISFGQRRPEWNPKTGRWLLKLQPYWAGHAYWNQSLRVYRIRIDLKGYEEVPSPSLGGTIDPLVSPWYIYEPNGSESYRRGLLVALFNVWYGLDRCIRDGFRFAEKHGIGILKAFFPDTQGDEVREAENRFITRLRGMGSEGVIPLKRGSGERDDQDVTPLEFSGGAGFAGIESARNGANVDIAVAGLGHNLTTEVKGGSFAAANVGDYIRSDYKEHDALGELASDYDQIGRAWALVNFGDPDLAPIGEAETDPPAADQTAASTYQSLFQALQTLPEEIRKLVDIEALMDRFGVAMRARHGVASPSPDDEDSDTPLSVGDRVKVRVGAAHGDIKSGSTGTVEEVGSAALGIRFDAMPDMIHRWYTSEELEPEGGRNSTSEVAAHAAPLAPPADEERPEVKRVGIPLTPTDLATIVTVDEGRASLALDGIGGDEGGRYIAEHAAKIKADAAPEIAAVANAEKGANADAV